MPELDLNSDFLIENIAYFLSYLLFCLDFLLERREKRHGL
jgi:hypothetical protein